MTSRAVSTSDGERSVREVVDEGEDVVRARVGERVERGAVGGRRVGRAPRVERVADVAERRQPLEERGAGGVGDRRQVDAGPRREVGDQRGLAGRDRDDAGPPAPDPPAQPPRARDQLGGLEQLVEVVAADHARRAKCGVGRPVVAGQRPGMGDRRGLGLRAAPDLHDHHRLVELERPVGEREEPLRSLEALEEQDDRVGLGVVEAVREEVARVEDDLAAAADDPREADPVAGVDERVRHGARTGRCPRRRRAAATG